MVICVHNCLIYHQVKVELADDPPSCDPISPSYFIPHHFFKSLAKQSPRPKDFLGRAFKVAFSKPLPANFETSFQLQVSPSPPPVTLRI